MYHYCAINNDLNVFDIIHANAKSILFDDFFGCMRIQSWAGEKA